MIPQITRSECMTECEYQEMLKLRNKAIADPESRLYGPTFNIYADKAVLKYELKHGFGLFVERFEFDSKAQAKMKATLMGWKLIDQTKPLIYANGEVIELKY